MSRYLVYFHPGDPVPDRMKYVDDATAAPDANDDAATLGVTVGSILIDQTAGRIYMCRDASTAAAVWTELTGVGGDSASIHTASASGAHDIDRADGATHKLTLTGNVIFTLSGASATERTDWALEIAVGTYTITWPTISWTGGSAPSPDAGSTAHIALWTTDGGTTIYGAHLAGSGASLPAGIEGDLLRNDGTDWVATTLRPQPMLDSAGGVQTDSAGHVAMHEVA